MRIMWGLFWMLLTVSPVWAVTLPTLPTANVDTSMPTINGTTYTATTCGDVQTHLNSAAAANTTLNHVINVNSSLNCTGAYWTLKSHAGPGWIILRTSAYASLPAAGTRVTVADAANMPSVQYTAGALESAITVETGANYYRIIGIEVLQDSTCTGCSSPPTNYAFIVTGYGASSLTNTGHIIIDQCVIRDTDTSHESYRGVLLEAQNGYTAVINSYVAGFKASGDSQAVYTGTNPGPILIHNSFLEAAGENVMTGASDPGATLTNHDITITHNTMSKNSAWWMGATSWTQKCLLEFKGGVRILVEGNIFENQAWDGQGFAFRFTVRNNSGGSPGEANEVSDLTFRYNLVRNVTNGFSMFGDDDQGAGYLTLHSKRWYLHDNLIYGLGWNCGGGADCGDLWQFASGGSTCVDTSPTCKNESVTITHNTVDNVGAFVLRSYIAGLSGLDFRDNLINANSQYGVFANFGANSWATTALNDIWTISPNWSWTYNRIAEIGNGDSSANYPQGTNSYHASYTSILWTDRAGLDYTLQAGSPAKSAASDGTDQGVNFTAYNAAQAGTSDTTAPAAPTGVYITRVW